jgi:hypothetical protein
MIEEPFSSDSDPSSPIKKAPQRALAFKLDNATSTKEIPELSNERKEELDTKYSDPAALGSFKCYFGKYKNKKTFAEVLKDKGYTKFILGLAPKTTNMYLFQQYCKAVFLDQERPNRKIVSQKSM